MPADFAARLAALGLTQAQLRRWIAQLTGRTIHPMTTSRYASGDREIPPALDALLATAEKHPAVLAEIKELGR